MSSKPTAAHATTTTELAPATVARLRPKPPSEWTDSAVAEAFARHIDGRFVYVGEWHQWYRWDGKRWAPDLVEAVAEAARQWVDDQRVALIRQRSQSETEARKYANRTRIDSVVVLARRMESTTATAAQFDKHPHLLNVRNGTIDLRDGTLHPHNPAEYLTMLADVDYRPDAQHDDVDAMLDAIPTEAHPFVRRLLGYCATGETCEDVVVVLDGTGANGKSTLLAAMHATLGDHAGPVHSRLVMASRHHDHPAGEAALRGRRFVSISETEEGGHLNGERLKMISGGDTITARFMHGNYFSFEPTHTLAIATNFRPRVDSHDTAVWRRLRLIPFPYTYRDATDAQPGDRVKDTRLRDRLAKGDRQREAMLAIIVEGARDYYANGLGHSTTVADATAEWQRSQDVIARFIDERLDLQPQLKLPGNNLYREYTQWCADEGHGALSNTKFAERFMQHPLTQAAGVEKTKTNGIATYRGVGTKPRSEHA